MAEADAEDRPLADQLADGVDDVVERRRVAGAVGEEDDVGVLGEHLLGASWCRAAGSAWQPRSRSWRTMLSLIPVSIPTTCGPSPSKRTGSGGVTVRARSAPSIEGSAAIRSRASASGVSAGKMPPRIAPRSRMWRTRARVSTPLIAGHAAVGEPVEPAALGGGDVLAVLGVAHDDAAGVDAVGLHRRRARPRSCRSAGR